MDMNKAQILKSTPPNAWKEGTLFLYTHTIQSLIQYAQHYTSKFTNLAGGFDALNETNDDDDPGQKEAQRELPEGRPDILRVHVGGLLDYGLSVGQRIHLAEN